MLISKVVNRIKTPLRKIDHPDIKSNHVVLDVGCGPKTNPRANVACDFLEADSERGGPLRIDRPFVWAAINALPFRDKAFDYSLLSHVLEHLDEPAGALNELQRVSKAGYIETPSALAEIAVPYVFHVSRVTVVDGKLIVTFKQKWDEQLPAAFADVTADIKKSIAFIMGVDWCESITRYRWKDRIDFEIRGVRAEFSKPEIDAGEPHQGLFRRLITNAVYQAIRPKRIDLDKYLVSSCCRAELIAADASGERRACSNCKRVFGKTRGHWDMRLPV